MHHLTSRPLDSRWPLRAAAHPRPGPADRPGVEGRLHSNPTQDRAEDRASDAPPTRRPPRPRPRPHQSRCRLLAVGCRGQPRQARDARCHPPRQRVGSEHRVTSAGAGSHRPQRPPRPAHDPTPPDTAGRPAPNDRHPANGHDHEPPTGRPTAHLNPRKTPIYTILLGRPEGDPQSPNGWWYAESTKDHFDYWT